MHDSTMESRNTHNEEVRISGIADWSDDEVRAEAHKLDAWLKSGELVSRQQEVVQRLVKIVAFELSMRNPGIDSMEDQFQMAPTSAGE